MNFVFKEKTVRQFIEFVITLQNVKQILEFCPTVSEKGFVFERLFDIVIKFGFCDKFPIKKFENLVGNSNKSLKPFQSYQEYAKQGVISGNSGGTSDITLFDKESQKYVFISSKFFEEEKSVDKYNIQDLVSLVEFFVGKYKNFEIWLIVKDKTKILMKSQQANISSLYITKYIKEENILDLNDLENYFDDFKQNMLQNIYKNFDGIYNVNQTSLQMRFHQYLFVQKSVELIKQKEKRILWGAKARSGKTFICGGLIIELKHIFQEINALIITPAPTETIPQFTEKLFSQYKEFNIFNVIYFKNSFQIEQYQKKTYKQQKQEKKDNIVILSKQLLQIFEKKIINLDFDVIFFDENHFGGTTDISQDLIELYSSKKTVQIFLTATYSKPLKIFYFPQKCQIYWDIEDENVCKKIYFEQLTPDFFNLKFSEKFIKQFISQKSIKEVFQPYLKMPNLCFITNMFDENAFDEIKNKIKDTNYGFSFETLFSVNKKGNLNFKEEIMQFLQYISGSDKKNIYKNKNAIYARLEKLKTRKCFTQIWFLPSININLISENLKKCCLQDSVLCNFNFMLINGQNREFSKDIKQDIVNAELIAMQQGKQGLILFAGNMINLGITLENCDIVFLFHNSSSSDKVIQQIYRCMTEADQKNFGIVVDFNINRVLQICLQINTQVKIEGIEPKFQYLIQNNLVNIDYDLFQNDEIDSSSLVQKLVYFWKLNSINNITLQIKKISEQTDVLIDKQDQKTINSMFIKAEKDPRFVSIQIQQNGQILQSGRKIIKVPITSFLQLQVMFSKVFYNKTLQILNYIKEQKSEEMMFGVQKNELQFYKDLIKNAQKEHSIQNIKFGF